MAERLSLAGAVVVSMDDRRRIFDDASVLIEDGRVVDVRAGYVRHGRTLDCRGRVVLPGLTNAHAHGLEAVLRGCGGQLSLVPWIHQRMHPLMAALDEGGASVAARLTALEVLRSGGTSYLDPEVPSRFLSTMTAAAVGSGLRVGLAVGLGDVDPYGGDELHEDIGSSGDGEDHGAGHQTHRHGDGGHGHGHGHGDHDELAEALAALDAGPDHGDRVRYLLGPRVLSGVTPELGRRLRAAADERGLGLTFHAAEVMADVTAVRDRSGLTAMAYAEEAGLLGERTVIAHGVHLEDDDLDRLAATGTAVAHCPGSNGKLGSGIARVPAMLERGIRLGLGTDGAACNDRYDLIAEMRLAALLHRAAASDPTAISAEQVLALATRGGADAVGLLDGGRLLPGSLGDAVVLNLRRLGSWPAPDVIEGIVFAADRSAVETVVVGGDVLLANGVPVGIDEESLLRDAEEVAWEAIRSAGLESVIRRGARADGSSEFERHQH
jgi:cytosine/adenosine deaminase-related metal-dependent hydrolase